MAPERASHLWVIGPGRVGLALGLALSRAGAVDRLTYSGRRPAPPDHPLFRARAAAYRGDLSLPDPPPDALLVAVPDAEIARVAETLSEAALSPVPVLHASGALGAEVLDPLARRGCPTGAIHPLVAVADPVAGAERLRGAWFAVEGDPAAAALAIGWVGALGGRMLPVEPGAKALYHAAAVFASNYVVTLLDTAERLMQAAGVPDGAAREAVTDLAAGAVRGVAGRGPAAALTGPIARGDVETVER
ncbi:MAG TPA: Rossmann-like and DUF2520 domain-containing protein, partial [Longimicrobiaceae bacterium]|nr:Rossmann-like and DUF2520 domain-containing protein [Longimicrobiaceae bacterium]